MKSEGEPGDTEFAPATQEALREFLSENAVGPKRAIRPVGGGTALDVGHPLSKAAISLMTTGLDRVIDFPARDMTVTVEAGIRIQRLAEVLKAEALRLPIDVAQPETATLGGALATNTSGPRRFGEGTFRDYVIGVTAVTADGREFHSGGRVVKNVAGYDLCKLLVGSWGTLAVVTQVTLKLKPIPESSILAWVNFESLAERETALGNLTTSQTRPVAIETLNAAAATEIERIAQAGLPAVGFPLIVGFEGSLRETEWQTEMLRNELSAARACELHVVKDVEADRLWKALTDFPTWPDAPLVFQASLLTSKLTAFEAEATQQGVLVLSHAGNGVVSGRLPNSVADGTQAAKILAPLERLSDRLLELRFNPQWKEKPPYPSRPEAVTQLMRALKSTLDPHGLLNPGILLRG